MLLKNIFISLMIIISFFYLTASILWGGARKRITGNLILQDIFIGLLISLLSAILLFFPIMTDSGTNIQIKTLGMVIAVVFFGNVSLFTTFFSTLVIIYFKNSLNIVYLVDVVLLLFILLMGIYFNKKRWNEKKRLIILTPLVILIKSYGFYLIDKWIYLPIGEIIFERLIQTTGYWMLMFIPALLLSFYIANQTKNIEMKLKKFENIANIDGLTGLFNRRYFDKQILEVWNESCQSSKPTAIIMIDIDNFKKYNDFYGHPKGDECLRKVATFLQLESGIVTRIGGEEFSILMPRTDLNGAIIVANRICKNIKKLEIEHLHSEKKIITVSIGVASKVAEFEQNYQDLIMQADVALYKSKRNGRDQVSY